MASEAELLPMGKGTAWGGLGQWGRWDPLPQLCLAVPLVDTGHQHTGSRRRAVWALVLTRASGRPEHARVRQLPPRCC